MFRRATLIFMPAASAGVAAASTGATVNFGAAFCGMGAGGICCIWPPAVGSCWANTLWLIANNAQGINLDVNISCFLIFQTTWWFGLERHCTIRRSWRDVETGESFSRYLPSCHDASVEEKQDLAMRTTTSPDCRRDERQLLFFHKEIKVYTQKLLETNRARVYLPISCLLHRSRAVRR
jgi:hypothetical protein